MLLAEELLLLLLDPKPGAMASPFYTLGVGGALLAELATGGHVEVAAGTQPWVSRAPASRHIAFTFFWVRPTGAADPTDPVLVEARSLIAAKERRPERVVELLGEKLRDTLLERLEAEMILRPTEPKRGLAGWFAPTSWPLINTSHPAYAAHVLGVRRQLEQTLQFGIERDPHTVTVAVMLWRLDALGKVLKVGDRAQRRELDRRARRLAGPNWVDAAGPNWVDNALDSAVGHART